VHALDDPITTYECCLQPRLGGAFGEAPGTGAKGASARASLFWAWERRGFRASPFRRARRVADSQRRRVF